MKKLLLAIFFVSALLTPFSKAQEYSGGLEFADEEEYKLIPFATTAMMGSLPERVDWSEWFPTPGNQGRQASCVGWALAYGLKSFQEAIEGSAFADMIDSEAEFNRLVEAHELMQDGDREAAKDIFDELGLPGFGMNKFGHKMMKANFMAQLSEGQREELKEAMDDKDHDRVKEILEEAGVKPAFGFKHRGEGDKEGRGFGHIKGMDGGGSR